MVASKHKNLGDVPSILVEASYFDILEVYISPPNKAFSVDQLSISYKKIIL